MSSDNSVIEIANLSELRSREDQIAARLNRNQLAAQLFLLDPIRALDDVNVKLAKSAVEEWARIVPEIGALRRMPSARLYDRVKELRGQTRTAVKIGKLLPPVGFDVAREDAAELRLLLGRTGAQIED